MDMSGMNQENSGFPWVDLTLRLILLLASAVVAGTGLVRPAVGALGRNTRWVVWSTGVIGSLSALLTVPLTDAAAPPAVSHAVLALAVAATLELSTPRAPRIAQLLGGALGLLLCVELSVRPSAPTLLVDLVFTGCCAGWLGMAVLASTVPTERRRPVRAGAMAVAAAIGLVATGIARLLSSGIAFDRRLRETGYGLALVIVVASAVALVVSTGLLVRAAEPWRAYRVGSLAVVAALLCSATLPAMAVPPHPPTPGVPLLAHTELAGHTVPVLVSPHRPGTNLVHFPESAGKDLSVRGAGGPVHARPRPGSSGTWAEVELPRGRGELVISRGAEETSVEVDTGTARGLASATGPQGPECASAALGALVADRRPVLRGCPSERLTPRDEDALRELTGFITAHGARSVSVVTDDSPRSRRAAEVIRTSPSMRDSGTEVRVSSQAGRGDALLVVSGWDAAGRSLEAIRAHANGSAPYRNGVFLAPWLSYEPILDTVASSVVPLRFDPRENRSLGYGMALSSGFGGEPPSVEGFRRWLAAREESLPARSGSPVALYAAAQVDVMKMTMPDMPDMATHGSPSVGQWYPRGTIVAISGPLP